MIAKRPDARQSFELRIGWRILCAVLLVLPTAARAQPLADRVPGDALVYVGWAGVAHLPPAYAQSHLKAFVEASNVRELLNESIPRLLKRVGETDDEHAEFVALLSAIGAPMWRHPSAVYFGGIEMPDANTALPKLAFFCNAGTESKDLLASIQKALNHFDDNDVPVRAEEHDGLVVVVIGKADVNVREKPAAPLSQRSEFVGAMAKAGKDPVVAVYGDVRGAVAMFDAMSEKFAPAEDKKQWAAMKDAFGLSTLHRLVYTGAFDGRDWVDQTFVEAPEPRAGLVKQLFEAKPLSPETLRSIPRTATIAMAGHFDAGALLGEIRAIVKKLDAESSNEFEAGLDQVKQAIGMDLQADILDTLGDEWALYSDPSVGGQGLLGLTLVNRLKDPAKADKAFSQLELLLNGFMKEATAREKMSIAFNTTKQGRLTIHYLAVPVVAPAWAIKDGNLYVALYPQIVSGAAEHVAGGGNSILDNPDFAATRKRLGIENASAVEFTDLKRTAAEGYQEVLMLSRVYLGFADLFGARTPPLTLPTLSKLMPHLGPIGAASWVDKDGWHRKAVRPFPGSDLFASGGAGSILAAQQAIFMGLAVPELTRARGNANLVKSGSNLRQIGQAMLLYANENKGKYPKTAGELLLTQDIAVDAFVNPATKTKVPRDLNKEEQAAWVNKQSDYVYLGAGKTSAAGAQTILAHEQFRPNSPGVNMLFGDGRVEFVLTGRAQQMLARQKEVDQKGAL